jgi:hypothetical protein
MAEFWTPDPSCSEIIAACELEAVAARGAVVDWQEARGGRHFALAPHQLRGAVRASRMQVRVTGDCEDYEYCRVGDGLVAGFGEEILSFGLNRAQVDHVLVVCVLVLRHQVNLSNKLRA